MASGFNPGQTYTGSGSTSSSGANTALPGTSSSTATQGSTTQPPSLSAQQIAQFESAYSISSTDLPAYVNGNRLTPLGQALEWYGSLSQGDRQTAQNTLVALGYLPATDATGEASGSSLSAFKSMLGSGNLNNFQTALADPTTEARAQAASQLASAEKAVASTAPVPATLENPTTLRATLNNAFAQTLGYAPSERQLDSFVSAMQGQDVAYAEAGVEQNKANAQAEATGAKNELTALQNLGSDGVDPFLSAYANAIHGTGVAGAGTAQGPVTGSQPNGNYLKPGTPLGSDTNVGFNSSGTEMLSNTVPSITSRQVQNTQGGLGNFFNEYNPFAHPDAGTHTVTTSTPVPGNAPTAPNLPPGLPGTTQLHGGLYGLSPGVWKQAVDALGSKNPVWGGKPPPTTAGAASPTEQQAAVRTLAQNLYQQTDSWQDVALTLAGGNPSKPTQGHVLNTSENLQTFAQGIAVDVNNEIQAVQSRANQPPQVVEKVSAPDASAEANQAAKQSDPVGYYAANAASFGGILNQMLAGAPQSYQNTTADTFTGPVGAETAVAA